MNELIDFLSELIYGSGVTPNHRTWVLAHPAPANNTDWLVQHVDSLLPAMQAWMSARNLPPLIIWDGTVISPWAGASGVAALPLPTTLDGSFTGITTEAQLSQALHQRLVALGLGVSFGAATELASAEKALYGFRYWGFIVFGSLLRRKFRGEIVVPPAPIVDRDGTQLSAVPFLDVFDELHWRWHDFVGTHGFNPAIFPEPTAQATQNTPKLSSSAGQRAYAIGGGNNALIGSEFFRFHRDHVRIYNEWLRRIGLPNVKGYLMTDSTAGGSGWPLLPATAPSSWVQANLSPWVTSDDLVTNINALRTSNAALNAMGLAAGGVHGNGHNQNGDIAHPRHNNYITRFFSWHEWIDEQWYFRAPRFGYWDTVNKLRVRVFEPVLSTGAVWPGLPAISIVRDGSDTVAPVNSVTGVDFNTGAGTAKLNCRVNDSYNRDIRVSLRAEVFNDAVNSNVAVETVTIPDFVVGPGGGTAHPLDTAFTVDFAFAQAFRSDSPVFNAAMPVGFVNSRIRFTGTLSDNAGTDTFDATVETTEVLLVKEKQGPRIDLFFNLNTFGEDQVNTAMTPSGALFNNALIVTVQDRTTDDAPITWPAEVDDAVKGLIKGYVPASGLFDGATNAPNVTAGMAGITVELASGPVKEDPSLPDNLPQRYTYFYNVRFQNGFTGFTGIPLGGTQDVSVTVDTRDRSNNAATQPGSITLLRAANPYMIDGDPAWLSIDTRVFRVFEGDMKFNATLPTTGANPANVFIQDVVNHLRAGTAGGDTFDNLPPAEDAAALVFFPSVTDHNTSTTRRVYNFALAKVRLQGNAGALNVRAFFRLFRYTATNLIFNNSTSYRTFDQGAGNKVPMMGFDAASSGGNTISIPFFAAPRVDYSVGMQTQPDPLNASDFPAGHPEEQVLYFGAYLDINQNATNSRLPLNFVSALAEQNGFSAGDVTSITNIFYDSHVCMVVEVNYDGDVTPNGADPFSSDNLAQRNLVILKSDNPGGPITHQVQHSFEIFTGERTRKRDVRVLLAAAPVVEEFPRFITSAKFDELLRSEAVMDAVLKHGHHGHMEPPGEHHIAAVLPRIQQENPLVFDAADWSSRNDLFDELMIVWNDLPEDSTATVYFPNFNCENIVNLRNLRHAPANVRILDSNRLQLAVGGITYLPVPAGQNARIPGIIAIDLPERVRNGQRWTVDVVQLRGEDGRSTGAFQVVVEVTKAELMAADELATLKLMFDRLSLLPKTHSWRPILEERVRYLRDRSKALADAAGQPWTDPTVWHDPDTNGTHPLAGSKVRVVLERIRINGDDDPKFVFNTAVFSPNNGGQLQEHRFPKSGALKISELEDGVEVVLDAIIFEGYVEDDLRVQIAGTEKEIFHSDEMLGKYTRLFRGSPSKWFGSYGPHDETPIEPEDQISWEIWYRIERP